MATTTEELRDISLLAHQIAGACWDDREREGSIGDQLRACAVHPALDSDRDRPVLRSLAKRADDIDRGDPVEPPNLTFLSTADLIGLVITCSMSRDLCDSDFAATVRDELARRPPVC